MSKDELYKDLESLLDEVDRLPLESEDRYRLHSLIGDIERHIDTSEEEEQHFEVVETVEELVTRLEADHPSFTGVLRRVLNALGSMGV
jgi:hypothetical protein